MTWKTWLKRGLLLIVALLFIGLAAGFIWLRTSLPQTDGSITVAGPTAPVTIIRDADGVPHIRAASLADARFALGFIHAQDRLFQMDFMRRLGAGRMSEVVGGPTIRLDRTMRTLGLYRLAEESLTHVDAGTRQALDDYAAGVNAFLDVRVGAPPPEFLALRTRPAEWKPADSLVWGRLMAMMLSGNWRTEALRTALSAQLSPEQVADLFAVENGDTPTTLADARPGRLDRNRAAIAQQFAALVDAVPESLGPKSASNSWVLSGAHTATGKPILANDPHLGFRAPVMWYLVRIETPEGIRAGATVPGVPFLILGHNDYIAWGFTTTESDVQDLVIEKVDPANPNRYLRPDGAKPFATRTETIVVRGQDSVEQVIRTTDAGPVISDIAPELQAIAEEGTVIAVATPALRGDDRSAGAVRKIGAARNWQEFLDAARDFHSPQQNITYADTDGNIGFIAPARVPIRRGHRGSDPVRGWLGEHVFTGLIPFEGLPQAFNPPSGRIVNANHRVVPDDYPYYLGHGGTPPYRAQRIHDVLDAKPKHDLDTSAALLVDSLSLMARDLLPLFLDSVGPRDGQAGRALGLLSSWDGEMRREKAEPLIFVAWLAAFNRRLYADETGDLFSRVWDLKPKFVKRVLTERPDWCDDVTTEATETCRMTAAAALDDALSELIDLQGEDMADWSWGAAHTAHFGHPVFRFIPGVGTLTTISTPSDGGAYTVNRAQHYIRSERGPYRSVHGPGFRAIYDLADLDRSRFMIATGPSGNPLSHHYDNLIDRWRDGEFVSLAPLTEEDEAEATGRLRLTPQ